jgi:hypothetical protein
LCAKGLYNIEARPVCRSPAATVDLPVVIRLLNGNRREVRAKADSVAPFLLWGTAAEDPASARQLQDGLYYLASSINGGNPIRIKQACPRPRPRRRRQCTPMGGKGSKMTMRCPQSGQGMM